MRWMHADRGPHSRVLSVALGLGTFPTQPPAAVTAHSCALVFSCFVLIPNITARVTHNHTHRQHRAASKTIRRALAIDNASRPQRYHHHQRVDPSDHAQVSATLHLRTATALLTSLRDTSSSPAPALTSQLFESFNSPADSLTTSLRSTPLHTLRQSALSPTPIPIPCLESSTNRSMPS